MCDRADWRGNVLFTGDLISFTAQWRPDQFHCIFQCSLLHCGPMKWFDMLSTS